MEIETLNMYSAPLTQITAQVRRQIEDGDYTPVTLLGKSGIGKTEAIRDLASDLRIGFREVRLSHYQESDLIGLPYIDGSGHTRHATAGILPPSEDEGQGILLLDEVTSAPRSMRSAVYQLLDVGRCLGEYTLPQRWLVVACGNGPDDGGDFRGLEPAFMSRGFCWRVRETLADWKVWALQRDIHPAVIAYLTFDPSKLHVMDPDRPLDMIACPRNWVKLSTQLKNLERRSPDHQVSAADLEFSAAGCVGQLCGPGFAAFYRCRSQMPDPGAILEGRSSASGLEGCSDEVLYLTSEAVVRQLGEALSSRPDGKGVSFVDGSHGRHVNDFSGRRLTVLVNAFNWLIDVGETIRLDLALTALQDIGTLLGSSLNDLVLSDAFDEACPRFAAFAEKNALLF